eukprot:TRINITY_DN7964_c0_g1_i1.p1 TRINITY_DN7964_c0_g1~~TRINITY_DN7964_c0_g1_i1.p1  ORF type:complete len:114 (+),score=54.51 TRINITY_DN7964_c0_g1_i1:133-474(+)
MVQKKYALFGQEAIGSTWALSKMNMFLHGEDNHRIEWGDTIRHPLLTEKDGSGLPHFDIVTANPPFSLDKWGMKVLLMMNMVVSVVAYHQRLKPMYSALILAARLRLPRHDRG